MQFFNTFVVACVIFASSAVANPAGASPGGTADSDGPGITVRCLNDEQKLTQRDGLCYPPFSTGFKSSQDCFDSGAGGYYCVFPGGKKCFDLRVPFPNMEGGECFDIYVD